jgi:DICT domain-containing protein
MTDNGGWEGLTIREISARSGVSEGTLRMWETRYDFPNPQRLASGHRRYSDHDLELVRAVMRAREQGLSLPTAIDHARQLAHQPRPSVYSALRAGFPYLQSHLLSTRALLSLSHAIEDECCARAERPLLFGCFQHERAYRLAETRWREMARTAERSLVLADFRRNRRPRGGPAEIAISESDPLMREWVVVCESPGFCACMAGWQRLGSEANERVYETIWTVEPSVVRTAARVCCELAAIAAPSYVEGLRERLSAPAPPGGPELRAAVDLTARMVLYATERQRGR